MSEDVVSTEHRNRWKRLVLRLAFAYSVLSIPMLLLPGLVRDDSVALWSVVLGSPLFGYVAATMGSFDSDHPLQPFQPSWVVFLVLNALWSFVFVWVVLRLMLAAIFGARTLASKVTK